MNKRMEEAMEQREELTRKVKAVRELHQCITIGSRLLTKQLLTEADPVRIAKAKKCIADSASRMDALKAEWMELEGRLEVVNS